MGEKDSYYACSNPNSLVKGQLYEVFSEKDLGFQTNYLLNGLSGEFNSVWFDEPISYFAYSHTVPVKGTTMKDFIRFDNMYSRKINHTSTVFYVEPIISDIYKAYTKHALYIVKVIDEKS